MNKLWIAIATLGLAASASASQPNQFDPDRGDARRRLGIPCELHGDCWKPSWPCDSRRDRHSSSIERGTRCPLERWPDSDRLHTCLIGTCLAIF